MLWPPLLAFVLGAMGAGIGGMRRNRAERAHQIATNGMGTKIWQFTLADLFIRMTVLAILLPLWIWLVRAYVAW
jgi:hypothetical protein